jgi:AcrR family transcriptional regulator
MAAKIVGRVAGAALPTERLADAGAGREALLQVAIDCFVEKGFHGTSMRDIAQRANASIAAIYYYFPSKADILRHIMLDVTQDLIVRLERARDAAGPDAAGQLAAVVRAHVRLHTERQSESFISNSELRSLAPADRDRIVALRDQVAETFRAPVLAGVKRGVFVCPYPHEATLALLTMCTAVAGWYRADGAESPQTLADRFAALALSLVGCVA